MRFITVICLSFICVFSGEDCAINADQSNSLEAKASISDMVMAFVVFRHGDRTPDQEELDKFPLLDLDSNIFFPYGKGALTNKGKQRAFRVGQYIRKRYDDIISKLYLPEEIKIQTTDFARTKMTVLSALSAIYEPLPAQQWHPNFNWQPIPYDTVPGRDNILNIFNHPRYLAIKEELYKLPKFESILSSSQELFETLSKNTGSNITVPGDVLVLDNLFQTLNNVNVTTPEWAKQIMPQIKEMTIIEYTLMYYTDELIRLFAGGLLSDILNVTNAIVQGDRQQAKLFLYSAHETNVAALLAATRTFTPHQPKYGATVSLELWKNRMTDEYSFMVVYAAEAGGPEAMLPVSGCGDGYLCDYNTFLKLTQDHVLPRSK